MIIRLTKSEEYDGVEVCNRVVSFEANELWERDTLEDGPEEDCCENIEIYEIVVFSDDMSANTTYNYPNGKCSKAQKGTLAAEIFDDCYEYAINKADSSDLDIYGEA